MARLKVLQICEATNTGVGKATIDLCAGLMAADCEVHLLYSTLRIDDAFQRAVQEMPQLRSQVLDLRRMPHPADAQAVSAVRRYIKKHGAFDIVHGQSSKGGAVARIAGSIGSAPVIYTPHCISTMAPTFGRVSRSVFRWVEWALALPTSMILCCSQEELDHIHSLGVPKSKLRIVHVAIGPPPETDPAVVRQALGLPLDAITVGFVGRLSSQKNPEMLLRTFASASKNTPQARLAFIGTGELQANCQELAASLGIADRVDWLGYREGYPAMPAFDILAVPSRYETGPYVMLEAMAVGLPVVITSVGRAPDVVRNGVNGFIVAPEDEDGFASGLKQLLESAELRSRCSAAAKAQAADFNLGTMITKTLAAYDEALGSRRRNIAASL